MEPNVIFGCIATIGGIAFILSLLKKANKKEKEISQKDLNTLVRRLNLNKYDPVSVTSLFLSERGLLKYGDQVFSPPTKENGEDRVLTFYIGTNRVKYNFIFKEHEWSHVEASK